MAKKKQAIVLSRIRLLILPGVIALSVPFVVILAQKQASLNSQLATAPTSYASGLTWSSGMAMNDDFDSFAAWRGRPLDNSTVWPHRQTWDEVSHPDIRGDQISAIPSDMMLSIGQPMLPESKRERATLAKCATGAYDQYFKTFGSELVRLGRGGSIVRLGWEANGDWYAWSITSEPTNYIACFRKEVAAIRSTAPQVKIDWNVTKESKMGSTSVVSAYPGDDVVDIIGVDFYDWWPSYPDQAAWDADYNSTQNGGPRGIGSWLSFAKSHGKKLSIPEWGVVNNSDGGGDNAFYIEKMWNFFKTNAADIAYETYFNGNYGDHVSQIYQISSNPNASAKYQQLWSMPGDTTN